jgi:hypothetical protein
MPHRAKLISTATIIALPYRTIDANQHQSCWFRPNCDGQRPFCGFAQKLYGLLCDSSMEKLTAPSFGNAWAATLEVLLPVCPSAVFRQYPASTSISNPRHLPTPRPLDAKAVHSEPKALAQRVELLPV